MCKRKKTIINRADNEVVHNVAKTVIDSSFSAIIGRIPFVGELINSLVPNLYSQLKKLSFNDFLYGINYQLKKNDFTKDDYRRFEKKLSIPQNYKYLSNIVDSVFFSQSRRARVLLGLITANYINQEKIPYEDLVIINALKSLLDDDLSCFEKIYKSQNFINNIFTEKDNVFRISDEQYNEIEKVSAEKLIALQLFSSDYSAIIGTAFLGVKTIISDRLFAYLSI